MNKTECNLNLVRGKYPIHECWNSAKKLNESIGYLKCLKDYFPALDFRNEITNEIMNRLNMAIDLLKNGMRDESQWNVIPAYDDLNVASVSAIINDATSHGYEFKIENGQILYRLTENPYQE